MELVLAVALLVVLIGLVAAAVAARTIRRDVGVLHSAADAIAAQAIGAVGDCADPGIEPHR